PSNRPRLVEERFLKLTAEAQIKCLRGAKGLREVRHKNPKKAVVDQAKFVADAALWDEYARFAPPEPPPQVFIHWQTDEWAAMTIARAVAGYAMPPPERHEHGLGRYFRGPLPTGAAALARLASVERGDWQIVPEEEKPRFAAWAERAREWIGGRIEAQQIY